jgi:magnesium transporter
MTVAKYTQHKLTWLDLVSPTQKEADMLVADFGVPKDVAAQLLVSTRKPHIEMHDVLIYVVLHFPVIRSIHEAESLKEIDFIITKNALITTRYEKNDAVAGFTQEFTGGTTEKASKKQQHAGHLFYLLIRKLYRALENDLEVIEQTLEKSETRIFAGHEKEMVRELSLVGRDIADFRKALGYHEEVLESLQVAGTTLFGEEFRFYLGRITGEYSRVRHQLGGSQSFFDELRNTNNSLLTIKQNEVTKTLTIVAFVTFPLTLVAGIFGMNTHETPIIGMPHDFLIVLSLMAALAIAVFAYFKTRRWL